MRSNVAHGSFRRGPQRNQDRSGELPRDLPVALQAAIRPLVSKNVLESQRFVSGLRAPAAVRQPTHALDDVMNPIGAEQTAGRRPRGDLT
jgi:hypothetical protein